MKRRFKKIEVREDIVNCTRELHMEIYVGGKVQSYNRPIKRIKYKNMNEMDLTDDIMSFALSVLNDLDKQ